MAVPKKRSSQSRKLKRRANHMRIVVPTVTLCPKCSEPKLPHRVCRSCGTYNGRQVIEVSEE